MAIIDYSDLAIKGPFWTAKAEVVSLMATSPIASGLLLKEEFEAYEPQQDPVNWRDSKGSNSLEEDDNLFKTIQFGNQISFGTRSTAGNIHTHYNESGALDWTNYEFTGRLRFSGDTSGIGLTFFSQFPNEARYYRVRRWDNNDDTFILTTDSDTDQIGRFKGNTQSGFKPEKNKWYRFRIIVTDDSDKTSIKVRFWQEGTTEPASFQIDAFDDLPDRLRAGTVGMWTRGAGIKYIDDLEVVGTGVPRFLGLRNIFVENAARQAGGAENVLLPGTSIALCRIKEAQINLGEEIFSWQPNGDASQTPTLEESEIRDAISNGELSLLLLQTDPEKLSTASATNPPIFDCLNGTIDLDRLDGVDNALDRLFEALRLDQVDPDFAERSGSSHLEGAVTLHGSGATIFGKVQLPWIDSAIEAPFFLAKQYSRESADLSLYRLSPEYDRMQQSEKGDFQSAWLELSRIINPHFPLNNLSFPPISSRWTTLEVSNPLSLPGIYWLIDPASTLENIPLRFEPGEVNLLFTDQPAYDLDNPPRSLGKITLADLSIVRVNNDQLTLTIGDASEPAEEKSCYLYEAKREENAIFDERVALKNLDLAFSPIELPRQLRTDQEIEEPTWSRDDNSDLVERPVLWASMPLEEGWVQWPVPNLTEQIYLDAGLAQTNIPSVNPESALLQGAVSFGNQREDALEQYPGEQPWSITLLDGQNLAAQWNFTRQDGNFRLEDVTLQLEAPDIIIEGLLWIGTGKPSNDDAIVDLENWTDGLFSPPLRTIKPDSDLFPSSIVCKMPNAGVSLRNDALTIAQFDAWELYYEVDASIFGEMVEKSVLPLDTFSKHVPLAWLRHASLPMVQALPLTQTNNPPNFPSASRQFAPFQLSVTSADENTPSMPDAWHFGIAESNSATRWPKLLFMPLPFKDWTNLFDLPIVSLSIPGLILDPDTTDEATGLKDHLPALEDRLNLPLQYRYDLPYTDEVNSLAKLPEVPRDPDASSPLPDSPPLEAPKPLQRETLAKHWADLSTRASLAQTDAVKGFRALNQQPSLKHLVEPEEWLVNPAFDLSAYPGEVTIDNQNDEASAPIKLSGKDALRGISGQFKAIEDDKLLRLPDQSDKDLDAYQIEAGSMAAHRSVDGSFRDQRGLSRSASELNNAFISTQLTLPEEGKVVDLTTTRSSLALQVDNTTLWQFWCKDLPLENNNFDRSKVRSGAANGVNDPDALSRSFNYLNGYEWRLANASTQHNNAHYLTLFNLHFYPLTLDLLKTDGTQVTELKITGRLQLPLSPQVEISDLSNDVQLHFKQEGGQMEFAGISLSSTERAVWPLQLDDNEAAKGTSITWDRISLQDDADVKSFLLENLVINFFLFDVSWSVEYGNLSIPETPGGNISIQHIFDATEPPSELQPKQLDILLDLASNLYDHQASLMLSVRLGDMPHNTFFAEVEYDLKNPLEKGSVWREGSLFGQLPLEIPSASGEIEHFLSSRTALQFKWLRFDNNDTEDATYFLPGFQLTQPEQQGTPGFASVTFNAIEVAGSIPRLEVESAFVETVLTCDWGAFLQDANIDTTGSFEEVFGSSAGAVTVGYTSLLSNDGSWTESFILNGIVEVNNLISWPLKLQHDETNGILTIPSIIPPDPGTPFALNHTRHTIRLLFNQQTLPEGLLIQGAEGLIFNIDPKQNWQFLAITEHQLIEITTDINFSSLTLNNDIRWTALQEIRFVPPTRFQDFLSQFDAENFNTLTPQGGIDALGNASFGYFKKDVHKLLLDTINDSLNPLAEEILLVEASAPHWVIPASINRSSTTTFQFQPTGNVHGAMSNVEDFKPQGAETKDWILLKTPFLGRLQSLEMDETDVSETPVDQNPFATDPVLIIQRNRSIPEEIPDLSLAFGSWSRSEPIELIFPLFDSTLGHSWPRLDPISIEENFFRLFNPPAEQAPASIFSISVSLNDTVARLSRPAALQTAFDGRTFAYPPEPTISVGAGQENLSGQIEWRPDRVLVSQAVLVDDETPIPYGWHVHYPIIRKIRDSIFSDERNVSARFAAATLIPSPASDTSDEFFRPHHLALSPYLSLEYRSATSDPVPLLISSELLCLDPLTRALKPCASHLWQLTSEAVNDRIEEHTDTRVAWAKQTHKRIAPDSPVAILRHRIINDLVESDTTLPPTILATYGFDIVSDLEVNEPLTSKMAQMRSFVNNLKFREGQFGGLKLPASLKPFEAAPPQVVGIQPVYLDKEIEAENQRTWPFGLSATRVSTQVTHQKVGVVGSLIDETSKDSKAALALWWQHPNYIVQYRDNDSDLPTQGLPQAFRAPAIASLLPVNPNPAMPAMDPDMLAAPGASADQIWQPVLPGSLRYFVSGARAGVMHALRHQLIRHRPFADGLLAETQGEAITSGSTPVQHRSPRPVSLPENDHVATALQTWGSYFSPSTNIHLSHNPLDEAFVADCGTQPASSLRVQLVSPELGAITRDWDGTLVFKMSTHADDADVEGNWSLSMFVSDEFDSVSYIEVANDSPAFREFRITPTEVAENGELEDPLVVLRRILGRISPGEILKVDIKTTPPNVTPGFNPKLEIPLRLRDPDRLRLPLLPAFIHFEDPEYNRQLASSSAHSTSLTQYTVVENPPGGDPEENTEVQPIKLSSDRNEYNPDSDIFFRFDLEDNTLLATADVILQRVDKNGIEQDLPASIRIDEESSSLLQYSLKEVQQGNNIVFVEGDKLQFKVKLKGISVARLNHNENAKHVSGEYKLSVDVVFSPVTPAIESAFGLLRWRHISGMEVVDCPRFAWGPAPARIELICPDDLLTEVVRRRAVFKWHDSVRPNRNAGYAIQKITPAGSTHFPGPLRIELE